MNIAIDFDGVIAYTNLIKKEYAKEHFNIDIPAYLCDKTSFSGIYDPKKYSQMISNLYTKEVTAKTPPVPGAINGIKKLSGKYNLALITNRTIDRMKWAADWLQNYEILDCFSSIHSSNNTLKLELCKKNNYMVLIDDDTRHFSSNPDNITKCLFKYRGYLFYSDHNNEPYIICRSWKEILETVALISG